MSNKLSSDVNTSSSEMQNWSKQRRHGAVSRRLFGRESIKNMDFTSEKFYFLLAEKYSKLKNLLEALENVKDSQVSDAVWIKMNAIVACLGEALQKLHIAKENGKNLPSAVCGKCIMLELFMDLKSSHKSDFSVDGLLLDNEILQQFQREVHLLKEACKEPFSLFPENAEMKSQSTQSGTATDSEQVKLNELEDAIVDLNHKNKNLSRSLEEVNRLLSKEKESLESIQLEKSELSAQISSLEEELIDVKQKENDLSLKNEELVKELEKNYALSSELKFAVENLEKEKKVSKATLDDLRAELQKNKLDLFNMKVEYEKQLNEQVQLKQQIGEKLENLESTSLSEKEMLNNNIKVLSSEKIHYQSDLDILENKKSTLEKKNALLNAELMSKCYEISTLQATINMLQACKETSQVLSETDNKTSIPTQCDFVFDNDKVKVRELEGVIVDANDKNKNLGRNLEETERLLFKERGILEFVTEENFKLLNQMKNLKEDLLIVKQNEKELFAKNEDLRRKLATADSSNHELNSALKDLQARGEEASSKLYQINAELEQCKSDLVSTSKRCLEYESQLRKHSQMKEEYKNNLQCLEAKKKETSNTLHQITAELEKCKSDLVSMSQRCWEYENQLHEHSQIKEEYEKNLQHLDSTLKSGINKDISLENAYKKFLNESESASHNQQVRIRELENVITDLNDKNRSLNRSLETVKSLLSKETEVFESAKYENLELCNEINNLKEELLAIKQREGKVAWQNEELNEDLVKMKKGNSELNNALKGLEVTRRESTAALDQMAAELQKKKLELVNMNKKCVEYEKELNEQLLIKEEYEKKIRSLESSSINEKETLHKNISQLNSEKNYYQKQLICVENKKLALEEENTALNTNLKSKCDELSSLQENTHLLQKAKETLTYDFKELQKELTNLKKEHQNLQQKCCKYEEQAHAKLKANEKEVSEQFEKLKSKSIKEKEKLFKQISELTVEREAIFQKLKTENESYKKLLAEKNELNKSLAENIDQISSLKLLNEELKNRQQSLQQRNEFFENALLSSNSECKSLSNDLKCLRQTLQNLESKCMAYEKEIAATAGMKRSLVNCLININSEFTTNRHKLNEMCKVYGGEIYLKHCEASGPDSIAVIDENNMKTLCDSLCLESKKLLQSVDLLLQLLKTFHSKARETTRVEEKFNLKTSNLRKEVEFQKSDREHLKSQNDYLQQVIDELQKSISEKEKCVEQSSNEIKSLKGKMHKSEGEIERGNEILKKKDNEIIMLQEKVFNLQSYVNTIMTKNFADDVADSVASDNQLPSPSRLNRVPVAVQTDELENSLNKSNESSILESDKHNCCEKYVKKFQTKLALLKKHIEILEKEKEDLQDRYLSQLQSKNTSSSDEEEPVDTKLVDLKSQLEQKRAFIRELKADLLNTCNSLMDKQREVDDLKDKLSEYERKPKPSTFDTSDHSISSPKTVDSKVKSLRNYKWTLIQKIFDIQRQFYEKKGIHLNYFNAFKDHVNNLYSLQLTHSLSKSESMPLLESYSLKQPSSQGEDRVKNMVALELDIQCLENLKIFLNRFFVPCILQSSQNIDEDSVEKLLSPDKLFLDHETEDVTVSKHGKSNFLDISFPRCSTDHLLSEQVQSSQHSFSFENFASNVSHNLDCMENFFSTVGKCQWLENYDLSDEESLDKVEVKSLLLQIFREVEALKGAKFQLFSLNALLKNYDFIAPAIPLCSSKPDVSDKESVMSEETIGISRSESPMSFEELCPVKIPKPETLTLEEKTFKPQSVVGRETVNEPYSAKIIAIESSCDSVCQRSHYSSPDLGIESDPNHESSAPEQKDDGMNKYPLTIGEKTFMLKPQQKTAFTTTESAGRFTGMKFGQTLYSIGELPHYELLKREIQESLVGIKSILSRTGDGLHHVAKYTSPRKTLEYSTLKAIKDSCANVEVCLKEAYTLIGKFWIAACPSEKEWKTLVEENQALIDQLATLRAMTQRQEEEFKKAMGRLEHAQLLKANMEKKISKKLVRTKKVIRQAELKLLENRCQNLRPVPKYPSEQASTEQQMGNV